ncbi:hypothetical protein EYZ11_011091 [Aspergillus tanneri]|uniref:Uncharacterized protein n=1 Tax=Aspergillus tanneri TaxID=1220188 RepID=A0A4S3J3N9_9EURO|nr:hypothetical protein EYZ11_011091 [Aspergillus tanneri]
MSRRRQSHSESIAMNETAASPFSGMQQNHRQPQRRGPIEGPNGRRLIRRVTWRSSTYKLMASLWVLGVLYIVWLIRDIFYLPFTPSTSNPAVAANDWLAQFVGRQGCGISSLSLYQPPQDSDSHIPSKSYCQTKDSLLSAMSNGGRHGFDASYTSQGCLYHWYTSSQVCDILHKFDGVVFVGDKSLADVYAGLNILLRENMEVGSLKEWQIDEELGYKCSCDSQFTDASCLPLRIASSDELYEQEGKTTQSPYICPTLSDADQTCHSGIYHSFVTTTGSPASKSHHENFRQFITEAGEKKKPIPVIHSLSLSTSYSLPIAKDSMDEWVALARSSGRTTPFLWVGPTAPGHQRPPGDNVHAKSWQYTLDTTKAAHSRQMDVLGMYNATLQADSWDGVHYGEKVALMQAMMIINWLSVI